MLPVAPPPVTSPLLRRRLLVGAVGIPALLVMGACTDAAPPQPPTDPDREALTAARDEEGALLAKIAAWHDAAGSIKPTEVRAVLAAHVATLDASLGRGTPEPGSTTSSSASYELTPDVSTENVVALLTSAANAHTHALRAASATVSPLLASIAASDAALAAALRRVP